MDVDSDAFKVTFIDNNQILITSLLLSFLIFFLTNHSKKSLSQSQDLLKKKKLLNGILSMLSLAEYLIPR